MLSRNQWPRITVLSPSFFNHHLCSYVFKSDTDTEVLVALIEREVAQNPELEPVVAVKMAFTHVEGAYGCAIVFADYPDMLIGLRRGSPLLFGIISQGNYVLASDASAVIEHTSEVVYLDEDKVVVAGPLGYEITGMGVEATTPAHHKVHTLQMTLDAIEKGGNKHCMFKVCLNSFPFAHTFLQLCSRKFLSNPKCSLTPCVAESTKRRALFVLVACSHLWTSLWLPGVSSSVPAAPPSIQALSANT